MGTMEKGLEAALAHTKDGGPQTPEGKLQSSQNAVKHGILATHMTEFDVLNIVEVYNDLASEFGDDTPSRCFIIQQLALTVVRLSRCARAETELLREALNPRVTRVECLLDISLETTVVVSEGSPATLSVERLQQFSLIHERYEPRLVARFLRLVEALKERK